MRRGGAARIPLGLLVPAGAALLFLALPLIGLLGRASWSSLPRQLVSADVLTTLRLSLETSLLAVVASLLLGVPLALVLARGRLRGERPLRALVLLPLVLPPVVGGIALDSALGRTTPIGRLLGSVGVGLPFTTAGAVVAETFVAFPFLVVAVEVGLRQADARFEEVAATLGARPWRRFWRVTLPLLAPALAGGTALCWARALGEFGATITFAGSYPGTTQTLPLAAYATLEGGDTDGAVTLSLILVVLSAAVLVGLRGRLAGALR